jgi:CRISPR-associated protein (TIGR02584 family)
MTEQKKYILIAPCGQTPQVITETIYYFYKMAKPPQKIQEVHIITTKIWRENIIKTLLRNGRFDKLCNDLNIQRDSIKFNDDTIYVPTYNNGTPIEDIKTDKDNELFAERLWELVKNHTDREDACVHCSITGGRKTMSAYAAVVMTLLGRPGDTLSHVLFDKDNDPKFKDFFYPKNKQEEANLHLANIPYLRLRGMINIPDIKENNFIKIIHEMQKELDESNIPKKVELLIEDHAIVVTPNGKIRLAPREFFLYHLLAYKRKNCSPSDGGDYYLSIDQILTYTKEFGNNFIRYYTVDDTKKWSSKETIREIITRINNTIDKMNISPKRIFKIDHKGSRPSTKYGINLPKDIIEFK